MKPLLLIGGGGHCRSCIEVIESTKEFEIIGIVDIPEKVGTNILGYPIVGSDDDLPELRKKVDQALITVGQIRSAEPRVNLAERCFRAGFVFPVVISPHAVVSRHATLGPGTIVMHGAIVNAGARVGSHVILNTRSLVEHDSVLGDFVHISTGAIVNGGVRVGKRAFLGSGCTTREYTEVPEGTLVKAGTALMDGRRLDPSA